MNRNDPLYQRMTDIVTPEVRKKLQDAFMPCGECVRSAQCKKKDWAIKHAKIPTFCVTQEISLNS